jgi:lipopolysaccharide exporter
VTGADADLPSAGRQLLHGSIWLIGLRWAVRLTGVVSTLILARLLSPHDFGVVAIAMIVVGMFEVFSWNGQELAIIRHNTPTAEHYNTAWTISAGIGFAIAAGIFLFAPLANVYFHDDRSIAVMRWLALRPLLSGLENAGVITFQRNLKFSRVFSYNFCAKVISFAVTIIAAIVLRNYWALVVGTIVGQASRTILSYIIHPYRPRISLAKRAEIWSFSIWSFTRAVGSYFITQIDVIAIGGVAGATSMGRYTVGKDVASSPVEELNEPVSAVLFPVMARYQSEPEQLRSLYLKTLGWAAVIGASASVGVVMIAQDMVDLILGSKWHDIVPLMAWLSLTAGISALTNSSFTVLDILGIPKVGARMQWLRVALMALALCPIAYLTHNLLMIAQARLAVTIIFVPSLLLSVGHRISVTGWDYVQTFWRPTVGGAAMAGVLQLVNNTLTAGFERLIVDVLLGILTFGGTIFALWSLKKQALSPEDDIVNLLARTVAS